MARLLARTGPNRGMSFPLQAGRSSVGRDMSNDVPLPDAKASRFHAEILREEAGWAVCDLGSSNGTHVNGKQVKRAALADGDEIRVGDTVLVFSAEEAPAGPAFDDRPAGARFGRMETIAVDRSALLSEAPGAGQPSAGALREANARLVKLHELSTAAAAAETVGALFEKTAGLVREAVEADRVFPILYDADGGPRVRSSAERPDSGCWTPWAASRARGKDRLARIVAAAPVSMTIVETVRRESKAVVTHAATDERFRDQASVRANDIGAVMCVPLAARGEFLGVLYADRLAGGEDFERGELEFLDAAAASVALALGALRSREEVGRAAAHLVRQVRAGQEIIGESAPMRRVFEFIERAAPTDAGVLVLGESGTGKELVARAIHYGSRRAGGPFETVNCAALSESLVESELFGHVKGAFTGATSDRAGRFELADGGTIFLDEIGELPDRIQTKLLRALEQGEIARVGDERVRRVDVRVVAATNRDIDAEVAAGRFRRDLFYRLNVLRVDLPPLRSRGGDLDLLIDHYAGFFASKCGRARLTLSPGVRRLFAAHGWPGNVRELRNALERIAVLVPADPVAENDLPPGLLGPPAAAPGASGAAPTRLEDVEREHVVRILASVDGNKSRAAEILGIDRSTLYAKLKQYGADARHSD